MLLLLIYSTTEIKLKRCCLTFIVHEFADSRCDRFDFLTCRSFTRFRLCPSISFATREARVLLDLIRISIWNSRATLSLSLFCYVCWLNGFYILICFSCMYLLFVAMYLRWYFSYKSYTQQMYFWRVNGTAQSYRWSLS